MQVAPVGTGKFTLNFGREYTNDPIWSIEQKGTVPAGAEYLACSLAGSEMAFQIDGQNIASLNPPGSAPSPFNITSPTNLVYGVSAFAGQEVQLAFAGPFGTQPAIGSAIGAWCWLDSLRFVSAPPRLAVSRSGTNLVVSWSASTFGYVLQSTSSFQPGTWKNVPIGSVILGNQQMATISLATTAQFFRLGLATPLQQLPPAPLGTFQDITPQWLGR